MERKGKGAEREEKRKEEMLEGKIKLKVGMILVGKRRGPSTPSHGWRLQFPSPIYDNPTSTNNNTNSCKPVQEFASAETTLSARKLCANLWEFQPHLHSSEPKMSNNFERARRRHHKDKKSVPYDQDFILGHSQPASTSTLRREVVASLTDHRHSIEKHSRALKPLSPSYGSSMEVELYKPIVTPSSSLDLNGQMGESGFSLKTSTELLKVLNRIWSLEEQQLSNISLLKALKMELDRSQSQVKQLRKEKQKSRQEMEDLIRQVAEEKAYRKNKGQDHIKAAIQSVEEELEDEKKLRKHSENLHRKLARELSELKFSFSDALKELEIERKARFLLENLCDEFAKGVKEYEQEVRLLCHKHEVEPEGRGKPDRLILHISEAWLDERMQLKLVGNQNDLTGKITIVDKLSLDIKTFLEAKHSANFEAISAPQDAADEVESPESDSSCFRLNNGVGIKLNTGSSEKQTTGSREKGKVCDKTRRYNSEQSELRGLNQAGNAGTSDTAQKSLNDRKSKRVGNLRFNSNNVLDNLVRNHSLSSEGEGDKIHPEGTLQEDACVKPVFPGHASPVQQWKSKLASPEFEKTESSLKLPKGLKENTLKAKLLEARMDGQKSRSRASKALH